MLPFPSFSIEAPDRIADAMAILREPDTHVMAGGTDILPSMKHRLFRPGTLVSLRRLEGMRAIAETPSGLEIGAGVTLRDIARHPTIRARWPALADAAGTVATPTIQAMGTLGGNVMLDTRCMYYNQPAGWRASLGYCLKREGTVCHVAPKGKGCYAAHSADTIPALWLYQAEAEFVSASGTRRIRIADLYEDDGMNWLRVEKGALLTRIVVPAATDTVIHRKLRTRQAIDYAWLLAGVSRGPGGYRAVLSAIGPRPIEVVGTSPVELSEAAFKAAQPLTTHALAPPYRKRMVRVEVRRAAESLS